MNASRVCVCACTHVYPYLKVKEGPRPFYLSEKESFELTHWARKSLFKYWLVAPLLLRPAELGPGSGCGASLPALLPLTPGTSDFAIV